MIQDPAIPVYDCDQVYVLSYEYLDAMLPGSRRAAIAAHLAACGHCREIARLQAATREVSRNTAPEVLPPGMSDAIARLIASDRPAPEGTFPDPTGASGTGSVPVAPAATYTEEDAALARSQMAG